MGQWTRDWQGRMWMREKKRRDNQKLNQEWNDWMRTEGTRMGLTTPFKYEGPILKDLWPEILSRTGPGYKEMHKFMRPREPGETSKFLDWIKETYQVDSYFLSDEKKAAIKKAPKFAPVSGAGGKMRGI